MQAAPVLCSAAAFAVLGAATAFAGSLIPDQSVTLDTAAAIACGRAMALLGAVALDSNALSTNCPLIDEAAVPEPTTWALAGWALACLTWLRRRHQICTGLPATIASPALQP